MRNIIRTDVKQKGECLCQSCKQVFHLSEVIKVQTEHNRHKTICPMCGSEDWTLTDPIDEEDYTYSDAYEISNKLKKMYEWDEYISMV